MTASLGRLAHPNAAPEPETISVLAVVNMVLRERYFVAAVALGLALLVAIVMLVLPRQYTAESAFMLQVRQTLPSNLSGLASQFGLSLPAGEASQSPAFYAELLTSREVLAAVVDSPFTLDVDGAPVARSLADWLDVRGATPPLRRDNTFRELSKDVAVSTSTRTGIVTLRVTAPRADLAAAISDRMLTWVNDFNLRKRQSQASAERKFTEARMLEAAQELQEAEDRMLAFTQRNRVTTSPLLKLEQDRLERVLSMRQQVYTSVVQAYDRAKIDEVRDTPVITVLQAPEAPVRPDPRGLIVRVLLTGIIGLGLGAWLASMRAALRPAPASDLPPEDEFASLWNAVKDDVRNPARTIGRLVRFGRAA